MTVTPLAAPIPPPPPPPVDRLDPGITVLRANDPVTITAEVGQGVNPGDVTVTIARDDGTRLATDAPAGGSGATDRTYDLTSEDTAVLDLLTATWTGIIKGTAGTLTTRYAVVSDFLFSTAEAREFDGGKLGSVTAYPDAAIDDARTRIATWFQQICGVSFVGRYRRVRVRGDGSDTVLLPDLLTTVLRSVATRATGGNVYTPVDAAALPAMQLDPAGVLVWEGGSWPTGVGAVEVAYEYGHAEVPRAIRYAALKVLTNQIIPSNLSDRTIQQSTQWGIIQLATPNPAVWGRWFGIPQADSALASYFALAPKVG